MSLTGLKSSFSCVTFLVGVARESISLLFQHLEPTITPWLMVTFLHVQSLKKGIESFLKLHHSKDDFCLLSFISTGHHD